MLDNAHLCEKRQRVLGEGPCTLLVHELHVWQGQHTHIRDYSKFFQPSAVQSGSTDSEDIFCRLLIFQVITFITHLHTHIYRHIQKHTSISSDVGNGENQVQDATIVISNAEVISNYCVSLFFSSCRFEITSFSKLLLCVTFFFKITFVWHTLCHRFHIHDNSEHRWQRSQGCTWQRYVNWISAVVMDLKLYSKVFPCRS